MLPLIQLWIIPRRNMAMTVVTVVCCEVFAVPALSLWESWPVSDILLSHQRGTGPVWHAAPLRMMINMRRVKCELTPDTSPVETSPDSSCTLELPGLLYWVKLLIKALQWLIFLLYPLHDSSQMKKGLWVQNTDRQTIVWPEKQNKLFSMWVYQIVSFQVVDFVVQLPPILLWRWAAARLTKHKDHSFTH